MTSLLLHGGSPAGWVQWTELHAAPWEMLPVLVSNVSPVTLSLRACGSLTLENSSERDKLRGRTEERRRRRRPWRSTSQFIPVTWEQASGSHEGERASLLGQQPRFFGIKGFHGDPSSIYRKQEACAQDQAHASVGALGMATVKSFRSCQIVPRQPNHQAVGRAV